MSRGRERSTSFYGDDEALERDLDGDVGFEGFEQSDGPGIDASALDGIDAGAADASSPGSDGSAGRRRSRTFYSDDDPASGVVVPPLAGAGNLPMPRDSMDEQVAVSQRATSRAPPLPLLEHASATPSRRTAAPRRGPDLFTQSSSSAAPAAPPAPPRLRPARPSPPTQPHDPSERPSEPPNAPPNLRTRLRTPDHPPRRQAQSPDLLAPTSDRPFDPTWDDRGGADDDGDIDNDDAGDDFDDFDFADDAENGEPLPSPAPPKTSCTSPTTETAVVVAVQDTAMYGRHGPLKKNEIKALEEGLNLEGGNKPGGKQRHTRNDSNMSENEAAIQQIAAAQANPSVQVSRGGSRGGGSSIPKKCKVLMLGDSAVGKTSLINRFVEDRFAQNLVGTVGVDFKMKRMWLGPNGDQFTLQIWDTAGQERFHRITKTYYRGADAIYLTFDCTSRETLDNLEYWVRNIKTNASNSVEVLLAANKVDLREGATEEEQQNIDDIVERGRQMAEVYGILYYPTSAKTGEGVEDSFKNLAETVYAKHMGSAEQKPAQPADAKGEKKKARDCVIS